MVAHRVQWSPQCRDPPRGISSTHSSPYGCTILVLDAPNACAHPDGSDRSDPPASQRIKSLEHCVSLLSRGVADVAADLHAAHRAHHDAARGPDDDEGGGGVDAAARNADDAAIVALLARASGRGVTAMSSASAHDGASDDGALETDSPEEVETRFGAFSRALSIHLGDAHRREVRARR